MNGRLIFVGLIKVSTSLKDLQFIVFLLLSEVIRECTPNVNSVFYFQTVRQKGIVDLRKKGIFHIRSSLY